MRRNRTSLTATGVAALRALGKEPVDPIAAELVRERARVAIAIANHAPRLVRSAITFGLSDHVRLRTLAIDHELLDAMAAGVQQVVILGAGLDARAYRLPELASARVFEIDHPASQAYKKRLLADRVPYARALEHVAVDFERDDLAGSLANAGHDPTATTFWIWEGVTMYLARAALRASLAVIRDRSAPESRIAVTYMLPRLTRLPRLMAQLARLPFKALGEPLKGVMESREFHDELAAAAFVVDSDLSPTAWAKRYERSQPSLLIVTERLVTAHRR